MRMEPYFKQKIESGEPVNFDPKRRLSEITSRTLTVENIGSYFDAALNDLVSLSERVLHAYGYIHPRPKSSPAQKEDLAFAHFGLQDIPSILSLIARKREELKVVDDWLDSHSEIFDDVIVPPGGNETNMGPGPGSTEGHMLYNRVKTVLYILADSGVDLNGVRATRGLIRDAMMRRTSYVCLAIRDIDRLALVCDEKGNASYIFDLDKLLGIIGQKELFQMTKEQINEMLRQNVGMGIRYIQSPHWAERTRNFLFESLEPRKAQDHESGGEVHAVSQDELDSWRGFWTAPDGKHYGPKKAIARKIGVGDRTVQATIEKLALTPPFRLRTLNNDWPGFPYEDIASEFGDMMATPQVAKEGQWKGYREIDGIHYGAKTTIMKTLDVPKKKIEDTISEKRIPAISIRDRANLESDGYPFETVRAALAEYLRLPKADSAGEWKDFALKDGIHIGTIHAISAKLGVAFPTIVKRVEDNKLEPVKIRGREETEGYSFERLRDLISNERDLPVVLQEGEWRGFYEKEGKHYGPVTSIANRLNAATIKANRNIVKRLAGSSKLQREDFIDLDRTPNAGYAYEDVLPIVKKFYDLPQVATDGPRRGFIEQNGKLYGTVVSIADRLGVNYSTVFDRLRRWQKIGTAPNAIEARDIGGSKIDAFPLSNFEERLKDLIEKGRKKS